MISKPIYQPKGRALEYCDYALNIYDSCPHGCTYCYARAMAKRFGKPWGSIAKPRPGIVEATGRQLATMRGHGKTIMLCFTCDPYPVGCDTAATREVILAIKESGNHVQILTKGDVWAARRDFDLLDKNDSFGVTLSGGSLKHEPRASDETTRRQLIADAHYNGISTWVSCEPVFDQRSIEDHIKLVLQT